MSYLMQISERSRKAGRFISKVHKEIQKAFINSGMKQKELAEKIGVNRSVVNKQLLGTGNLTLRSISDLAWAMGADIEFSIRSNVASKGVNFFKSDDLVIAKTEEEDGTFFGLLDDTYTLDENTERELEDA
ncbi:MULTISPECIES: helix-turn-helix transcriptional regulator [unclassified Mesorhizobium]|uniref:helix-turn-helix domain-containing protein n=1 Tax=unclassified Mesorhizobium TaxID=325217 RepID=UPI00333B16C0